MRGDLRRMLLGVGVTLIASGVALACSAKAPEDASGRSPDATETAVKACGDPRPELCTQDYRPVCATRDTGIRCVQAPCPSSERKTYSNACAACSDPEVDGWVAGRCPDPPDPPDTPKPPE